MELVTKYFGEAYIHKMLWTVVQRQFTNTRTQDIGSKYEELAVMVFSLHAFEAYLNYIGFRIAPDTWKDERNYFRKEPYRGFDGKVRKVFALCDLQEPDRTVRPYSTIWSLKKLRDAIAHGAVEVIEKTLKHAADEPPPFFSPTIALQVTHDLASEAVKDIDEVAKIIHAAAKPKTTHNWFGDEPFGGVHNYSERHTTQAV